MPTKLSLEIDYPDGEHDTVVVTKDAWDLDIKEMCLMFTSLMRGAGFFIKDVGEIDEEC